MAYNIEFTPKAAKQFSKLDTATKKRIQAFLLRIQCQDDPRALGKPLQGSLAGLCRYRAGDYRILTKVDDGKLIICIVDVDHRSSVYR